MAKSNRSGQATVLTPDQLGQIWAKLEQPYRLVTQIAYFTAARVGEVVSLQRSDLRGDRIVFRAANTKTRTTKESIITPQLATAIADAQIPASGYLFPSGGSSGHITTRAVDKHLRRAAGLIGVDGVSLHSFRRSQATHLHQAGIPLRAIQRITGHSSLASLERYLDVGGAEAASSQAIVMGRLFGT
jgi:integrase/recombinase XerD